jgi:hypothetical protein
MATTARHRLTLNLMGKCSNTFFSETTDMIKAKLYMNVHWMVLYKLFLDFFLFKSIIEFMYSIEIIFLRGINKEILIVLPAVSMIVSRSQQTLIKAFF